MDLVAKLSETGDFIDNCEVDDDNYADMKVKSQKYLINLMREEQRAIMNNDEEQKYISSIKIKTQILALKFIDDQVKKSKDIVVERAEAKVKLTECQSRLDGYEEQALQSEDAYINLVQTYARMERS